MELRLAMRLHCDKLVAELALLMTNYRSESDAIDYIFGGGLENNNDLHKHPFVGYAEVVDESSFFNQDDQESQRNNKFDEMVDEEECGIQETNN